MFRVWIGNLGKYNEGYLLGKWVDLPIEEEDLEKVYADIKVGQFDENGEYQAGYEEGYYFYEETYIGDYENDLGIEVGEYDNVLDYNEVAELCEKNSDRENEVLESIIKHTDSLDEALEIFRNGEYFYFDGVSNLKELGDYVLTEGYFHLEVSPELMVYIDENAVGELWEDDGHYVDKGFLVIK